MEHVSSILLTLLQPPQRILVIGTVPHSAHVQSPPSKVDQSGEVAPAPADDVSPDEVAPLLYVDNTYLAISIPVNIIEQSKR